jgi:hypothetical protein
MEKKIMTTTLQMPQQTQNDSLDSSIPKQINNNIDEFMASLPAPNSLTSEERRRIIARYTAVLEGNFIYWMTATLIAVKSEDAKPILLENLHEEIRDAHPAMMRSFAMAAHAFPTDSDALAVHEDLTKVRRFLGRLSAVQSLATMAFFEGLIQRFMSYLAALATAEGSSDMEYTDVHGVCDIAHTEGLIQSLALEMAVNPLEPGQDILEGVNLLRTLMDNIIFNGKVSQAA